MKLYELAQNYNNLYDLIEDESIPIEAVEEGLAGIEDSIEEKVENIAGLVKEFDGKVNVFKEEEKRLNTRRKVYENRVKSLKDYLLNQLDFMERTKIEGNLFTVRKQKSPAGIQVDENLLSEDYLVPQPPKADKKLIKDELKAGNEVKGASYEPDSYHVRIQ